MKKTAPVSKKAITPAKAVKSAAPAKVASMAGLNKVPKKNK